MEVLLTLLSYAVMSILLSLAIMFRYSTELSQRGRYFKSLSHLGYTGGDIRKIKRQEVTLFYIYVFVILGLYLGMMFLGLILKGMLAASYAGILSLFVVIPLIVCWGATLYYYSLVS